MIKIEKAETMGWGGAIRGMRNAMNSWDKSDSKFCRLSCITTDVNLDEEACNDICGGDLYRGFLQIGEADMKLCKNLIKAGSPDRKFMRMIHVQADVTAPLYWWKEYDTYKVGTVANSCSTMHTLHKEIPLMDVRETLESHVLNTLRRRDLTIDDFSHEHLDGTFGEAALIETIRVINNVRAYYNESKSKEVWYAMIQLLPSSFNQMRTIDLNYENLLSIYHQRKNHKLDEWREFCKWIETLPYMKEFLGLDDQIETKDQKNG